MEIGKLRWRVDLIKSVPVDDGSGGKTRSDSVLMNVWAHVAQASFNQTQRAQRLEQRVSHTITVRYRRDLIGLLKTGDRARYSDHASETRELSVQTVADPDGRGNWIEIGCLEGGPK